MKHSDELMARLDAEESEVSKRLRSLELFMGTGAYAQLPGKHKALLSQQHRHMRNYWHILCQRITLMKGENEKFQQMPM
jgi:hypothetical protein